jgi:hypothetical protein
MHADKVRSLFLSIPGLQGAIYSGRVEKLRTCMCTAAADIGFVARFRGQICQRIICVLVDEVIFPDQYLCLRACLREP